MHLSRRALGFTLIELLMFIMVVGIALAAMLRVFTSATTSSADPIIRRQQLAIAESLLREVQAMPFTWCDPTDANADSTAITNASGCASLAESSGPEAGQTRYGPNYFNNVDDYAGFQMTGIRDLTNTVVSGLSGYSAKVAVATAALSSVAAPEAVQITVTVVGPGDDLVSLKNPIVLQGWRTRYAPTAPF